MNVGGQGKPIMDTITSSVDGNQQIKKDNTKTSSTAIKFQPKKPLNALYSRQPGGMDSLQTLSKSDGGDQISAKFGLNNSAQKLNPFP